MIDVLQSYRSLANRITGLGDYWEAHDSRETIVGLGDVLKRTALQRLQDVMESKELAEKHLGQAVGAEKAAELWSRAVMNMAPSSEKVTTSFVDACFTVNARLLSNEKLQTLCEDADSAGVTPLDSIYK